MNSCVRISNVSKKLCYMYLCNVTYIYWIENCNYSLELLPWVLSREYCARRQVNTCNQSCILFAGVLKTQYKIGLGNSWGTRNTIVVYIIYGNPINQNDQGSSLFGVFALWRFLDSFHCVQRTVQEWTPSAVRLCPETFHQ